MRACQGGQKGQWVSRAGRKRREVMCMPVRRTGNFGSIHRQERYTEQQIGSEHKKFRLGQGQGAAVREPSETGD